MAQTYQQQLQGAIQNGPLAGLTDAQILALAGYGVPQSVPRTGLVNWVTLGSSAMWGSAKAVTAQAVLAGLVAAGQATGATQSAVTTGIFASGALTSVSLGFNPQDPAASALIANLGAALIAATAGGTFFDLSGNPVIITSADISAVTTISSYAIGQAVVQADLTAARATVAAQVQRTNLIKQIQAGLTAALQTVPTQAAISAGTGNPTAAQIQAAFTAKVTG